MRISMAQLWATIAYILLIVTMVAVLGWPAPAVTDAELWSDTFGWAPALVGVLAVLAAVVFLIMTRME